MEFFFRKTIVKKKSTLNPKRVQFSYFIFNMEDTRRERDEESKKKEEEQKATRSARSRFLDDGNWSRPIMELTPYKISPGDTNVRELKTDEKILSILLLSYFSLLILFFPFSI